MMESYHADVVAVQQKLGELDLSAGVVTAILLVWNTCKVAAGPFETVS